MTGYITTSDADSYFTARNNLQWSSLSYTEKDAAVTIALEYFDAKYTVTGSVDPVPDHLKHALCQLSLLASQGKLMPDADAPVSKFQAQGSVSVWYDTTQHEKSGYDMRMAYVNALLKGIAVPNAETPGVGLRLVS